jgi:hypothetical protein
MYEEEGRKKEKERERLRERGTIYWSAQSPNPVILTLLHWLMKFYQS